MADFKLRLPDDLKRWLEDQATKNGSSQNSEMIRAIRAAMEGPRTDATPTP